MKAVSIIIPPDKSISHRAVMLASISESTTCIKNLLMAEDIKRTIEAFRAMGVSIFFERGPKGRVEKFSTRFARSNGINSADIVIDGVGMAGLKKPARQIYLGNSGTTMRILPGILAGQDFEVVLTGDKSLSKRPMRRIAEPLIKMGAEISGSKIVLDLPKYSSSEVEKNILARSNNIEICSPLKIHGGKLKGIRYNSNIASGQVKSCILLAGLYADGVTSVSEPEKSRDHTERMLRQFGVNIFSTRGVYPERSRETCSKNIVRATSHCFRGWESRTVSLKGPVKLKSPGVIEIPGDISSAAFFIVAGCILPDMKIIIKNIGLNPTRTGVLDILKRMGGKIDLFFERVPTQKCRDESRSSRFGLRPHSNNKLFEPSGNIIVKSSKLRGVTISPKEVVRAIDEIPVIMVAACFAKGRTIIKGIEELRVKETDRIKSMVTNLRKIGADIDVFFSTRGVYPERSRETRSKNIVRAKRQRREVENNREKRSFIVINGGKLLHGARVSSFGDHRTAMSMLVAGLGVKGKVNVTGLSCINKSFPGFERLLRRLPQKQWRAEAIFIN